MSEESQVSKVTLCVKILKWQSLSESLTKVRYRAAGAAKKLLVIFDILRTTQDLLYPPHLLAPHPVKRKCENTNFTWYNGKITLYGNRKAWFLIFSSIVDKNIKFTTLCS